MTTRVEVLIVGAGFSGLGLAALLDRAGIRSFRILEAADDVGGTWRENTYPGCACDIPAPLYSFSFAQKADWTRLFARQGEILAYLRGFARDRGLTGRIDFGAKVANARWRDGERDWELTTAGGRRFLARFLVTAVGPLHHPVRPALPGVAGFRGPVFHSAEWAHDVDLTGRRVVVIGTGASAVQFVPAIVDRVAELTVFQRTPPWILPKADRAFDARERRLLRWLPGYRQRLRRHLFQVHEHRAPGFVDGAAGMAATAEYARRLLEKQVEDPELRARLTPDYAIGCKRLLISSDWYPALTRPHVRVRTGEIARVRPDGVVGADGVVSPAEVIIYGTGFDAHDNLTRLPVHGRDGLALTEVWRDGAQAYLGTTVSGFPNLFVLGGPNTGLGHNSQIFMIEAQARYVVACLRRMRRRGLTSIEVRPEAQRRFVAWVHARMAATVWQSGGCRSWYQRPRSALNTVLWPDTAVAFAERTRRVRFTDYRFEPPAGTPEH
ncbi:MAG TPA: NAD(P)/FAD-dependent oxidoreductase [Amycolatopsis sp.]|nr:NAD(P)/FAD-dependent oxidoreductase [Amycolatopsis sp.]